MGCARAAHLSLERYLLETSQYLNGPIITMPKISQLRVSFRWGPSTGPSLERDLQRAEGCHEEPNPVWTRVPAEPQAAQNLHYAGTHEALETLVRHVVLIRHKLGAKMVVRCAQHERSWASRALRHREGRALGRRQMRTS